jgi:hypothetical protein
VDEQTNVRRDIQIFVNFVIVFKGLIENQAQKLKPYNAELDKIQMSKNICGRRELNL